jgi:glycosyltransferase involved in cell wall biosynthesis
MRVVHHSKTIGYAGTDRVAQLFCKYLLEKNDVEPFLMYREGDTDDRLEIVRDILGNDRVVPYQHEHAPSARPPYYPLSSNFAEVLAGIKPDILHVHRSGYPEWPLVPGMIPDGCKVVETNIFGNADITGIVDINIYISEHIRNRATGLGNPHGPMIFNPTDRPSYRPDIPGPEAHFYAKRELIGDLQERYAFKLTKKESIFVGRVGRPDNFDPIALKAWANTQDHFPNAYYLVVNGCKRWRETASELGCERVIFMDPIIDDFELSRFYTALDVYAHARHDGECCPCNIQEAMMHGVPVISHVSQIYNGQSEIIGDAGFVAPFSHHDNYAEILWNLLANAELRDEFSILARRRAMRHFEASCVTTGLVNCYKAVLEK